MGLSSEGGKQDLCTIDYVQVDAWLLQQGRYELMAAFVARQMQWSAHDFPTTQPTCHPGAPAKGSDAQRAENVPLLLSERIRDFIQNSRRCWWCG